MNILQLTDYLPDYSGNFGNTLIALAKKVSSENGKYYVSFPVERSWHKEIKHAGGEVLYVPVCKFRDKKVDLYSIKYFNKIIKKQNIKIVHVHFGLSQKVTAVFLKIFNPKIRVIWHWRGDVEDSGIFKMLILFLFYRILSGVFIYAHITNSNYITKRLMKKKLVNSKKLHTLPNAINVELFHKQKYLDDIKKLKIKYNTNDIFTIIMIRNFRKRVDFKIILDAMQELQNEDCKIQLLWIGYGETEQIIKKEIQSRKLFNIMLLGQVRNPIKYYYISKVNIIAWESWCNETINNTAYESLASKIPVIGLNFGALPLAFNENDGVFCVPLDPVAYANKIIDIKNNYIHYLKLVNNGYKKVINNYALNSYVNRLFIIYKSKMNL